MEQRRLRLGDIVDDYCPRERRVTNHAVVAMIEEDIKQTRCTTCDAEHAYKGARVPKRRKKDTPAALYSEVLAGLTEGEGVEALAAAPAGALALAVPVDAVPPLDAVTVPGATATRDSIEDFQPAMHSDDNGQGPHGEPDAPTQSQSQEFDDNAPADTGGVVDGPVHRRLIRATLPRPEGQKDARPVPDFTVRHAPPRGNGGHGQFRGERMRMRAGNGNGTGHGGPNGNRASGNGQRFHGNRQGRPGSSSGFRNGNAGPNGKRGRGPR
jgi:hypothetical protein